MLVAACWAVTVPGSSAIGVCGMLAIVGTAEAGVWLLQRRGAAPARPRGLPAPLAPPTPLAQPAPARPAADSPADNAPADDAPADDTTDDVSADRDVLAETVRRRAADGHESIHGWTLAEFAAGQRSSTVHVAFCPALAGQPSCEAEQVAGPPATVRVIQILPLGARIEARLDAPASRPVAVRIEFAAAAAGGADQDD